MVLAAPAACNDPGGGYIQAFQDFKPLMEAAAVWKKQGKEESA
jgi:hypothetical protein